MSRWYAGWWFGTFFIFHSIWANPSHWLSYFSEGWLNQGLGCKHSVWDSPQLSVGLGRNPPLTLVGSHWRWRFPRAAAFFARRFCLLCSVSFVLTDNTFAPGQGLLRKRLCQQFCIGLHPLAVFDPGCKPHPICNSIQFYLFLVLRLSHWLSHDPGICA